MKGACLVLLAAVVARQGAECAAILAMMTVPSHSHHIWSLVYLKGLVARGHNVTYLGVDDYSDPAPGIRYIQIENAYALYDTINFTQVSSQGPFESLAGLMDWYDIVAFEGVKQNGFKLFLDVIKREKFDLVVFDLGTTTFLLGAVDVLGRPPVLGVTAFGIPPWTMDFSGTPYPVQNNAHFMLPFGKHMTFWERVQNALFYLYSWYLFERYDASQEGLSKATFGPGVRTIREIENDIAINVVNANWATENPFPVAPGLIPVSGLHIHPVKPLPQDLKAWLDASVDGVIYFSLGSNIQSAYLQEEEVAVLTAAFRQLAPVRVLWKWEKPELPGRPDNVRIAKWLPQNDILSHPNVRLFFTHGGMLGSQEAVYHGVPIVGMPVFLDQHVNVAKAVRRGYGESLKLSEITAQAVVSAVTKVLTNPRYKKTAVELSRVFRDQMTSGLDTAVYWTEYALLHDGAKHLRPASKDLAFFQAKLWDVTLALLLPPLLLVYVLARILARAKRAIFSTHPKLKRQ